MTRIRVAIGEVQSAILEDILVQITHLQPDMEFVGQVEKANLKESIARRKAEVLICEVGPLELPQVCRELFTEENPPLVVGLARGGREAIICIANAGVAHLTSVIRSALLSGGDSRNVIELFRPSEPEPDEETVKPYSSNSECLDDQLRSLDLALLAEVEAFESTIWDESVQRMQGLAISPDEVRALLQKSGSPAHERQGEDLRRRRQRLAGQIQRRIVASLGRPDAPPFVRLIEEFGLEPFEQFCVLATLALELDRNTYGKAYAFLQDDATRKNPSLELLLRLYEGPGETQRWETARAFDTSRPLRRWSLLRVAQREEGEPSTPFGRRIELDDRIARFLLGLDDLGPQLEQVATTRIWEPDVLRVAPPHEVVERLSKLVGDVRQRSRGAPPHVVVQVHGRSGTGRRLLVASACEKYGLRLLRVNVGKLMALPPATFEEMLNLLARESMLQPLALCLENVDPFVDEEGPSANGLRAIAHALQISSSVTFLIGERPWSPEKVFRDGVFQRIALDLPDKSVARRIWIQELANEVLHPELGGPDQVADQLAAIFSLSPGQIHDAVAVARIETLWQSGRAQLTLEDLYSACRQQYGHRLAKLATQVSSGLGWDDLVLPEKQFSQLRELQTSIQNSSGVLQDWNFASRLPYGRGITALFSGPSGTGKTMAAGILARELGLDLYKIDLSRVVSKYIGETEKNLDRIFEQAEDANAMLFFDEADALFGKRSAVKEAHDRYANIEIAYLLQKMEERLGVTILATNLKTNMDEAFVRRIRYSIDFPMPEYAQRLQIWRGSLPAKIRLADDVDLPRLAKRLRVSGGSIMNVCVGAASLAYEPGGEIAMKHFLHAAKRELQKLGQQYDESDFAGPQVAATAA
ncbi:MAG: ATP-binding protein [Pyrinomonadaceae bacterium]